MSLLRWARYLKASVLFFLWLKRHRRIISLLSIFRWIFLSRMIFTAVGCGRILVNTAYLTKPGFMERKQMSIWWFLIILGIWIFLQAYLLPKLGIST
jgi:hypothetical protein